MSCLGALVRPLILAVLLVPGLAFAQGTYMRVMSFNLRHAGWPGMTNYAGYAAQIWNQYGTSSTSTNGCDIVLAQEVMYESSAQAIAQELTRISGRTWAYAVSPPLGRSASYKELYAVFYRTDRVSLLSNTIYSDVGDRFEREPQIVRVRDLGSGADFTFINWHTIFGTVTERQTEVSLIHEVFRSVQNASASDQDVILLGDHNLSATAASWSNLTSTSQISPQVSYRVNDLTTLNTSGGFVSPYDHFWLQSTYVTEYSNAGRDYIGDTLGYTTNVSDHAPIWLRLYATGDTD